ncbi:TetR/AcrR family transcriptional regulator [Ideonella margarita]|uniref:TetR/AcrR family transcriptional regulator n=1 Tax=Ideonella margarita TaxID=2984191 RepID=A0ABU9C4Y4_9BURK
MARPRSSGYDDQRELILRHAAALFATQGYVATSMNEVAAACGVSKAALYHYVRDKRELLESVCQAHVLRLQGVVAEVLGQGLAPEVQLRELIVRFVQEYASAQNEHRVLTKEVKLLEPEQAERVLAVQRAVVADFALAVAQVRPALQAAELHTPLTMLLFGMINWLFTWFRPGQPLTHAEMAPIVADLFFGGLAGVTVPATSSPESQPVRPRTRQPRKKETTS